MKIAITGGTGFIGRHLAVELAGAGHEVVLLARGLDRRDPSALAVPGVRLVRANVTDVATLRTAFEGCDAVAHCAGINRQLGAQTYLAIHVHGTSNVVEAARATGVARIALLSFLRARPACGSGYHESKWKAEETVRGSGLDYTVVKASMTYGNGDHMLDHLSHLLYTMPLFAPVGLREKYVRPVAVQDLVRVLVAALVDGRLSQKSVAVMGPETIRLSEAARRVGRLIGHRPLVVPAPVMLHYLVARLAERLMTVPLVAVAQVRMLSEGLVQPWGDLDPLPDDLVPVTPLSDQVIRQGLPAAGRFTRADLRIGRGPRPKPS